MTEDLHPNERAYVKEHGSLSGLNPAEREQLRKTGSPHFHDGLTSWEREHLARHGTPHAPGIDAPVCPTCQGYGTITQELAIGSGGRLIKGEACIPCHGTGRTPEAP